MTTVWYKFFLVCFFFFKIHTVFGTTLDTVKVIEYSKPIDVLDISNIFSSEEEFQPDLAWSRVINSKEKTNGYVGHTNKLYWVGFTIKNELSDNLEFILEIANPQIDRLSIYEIGTNSFPILILETGDKYPFSHRLIAHRNFVFPIKLLPTNTKSFLIKIDKRNSSLHFPIYLRKVSHFYQINYNNNLIFGLCFGFMLLCFIYALFTVFFLRKAIYVWYSIWIAGAILYSFTNLGFSFQYLYPRLSNFNSYFRIYLEVIVIFSFIKFSKEFLNLHTLQPKISSYINFILWLLIGLVCLGTLALNFFEQNGLWTIPLVGVLLLTGEGFLIWAALASFSKQPITVIFYFAAFGFLIFTYFLIKAASFGWLSIYSLLDSAALIGSAIEIVAFSVALTYKINKVYDDRNQLSAEMAQTHKRLLRAYVDGVEKERQRISIELHDDIGSRLGSLKRLLKGTSNELLENKIDYLFENVRAISKNLSSPSLIATKLDQRIMDLAYEIEKTFNVKLSIQFYDFPTDIQNEISHHFYRLVQEAVSNSIRHGFATEIDIQFFRHKKEFVLTIDDNGNGFCLDKMTSGIGINNMKVRTALMDGTFEITSTMGRGTSILIKCPLSSNPSQSSV
jgi:two-component system, sensor histidine kinase LadS